MRAILLILLLNAACEGVPVNRGVDQPLSVDKGSLHAGALDPAPETVDDGTDATDVLAVTAIELPSGVAGVGESRTVNGRVVEKAYALAVQLASTTTEAYGSGYWVVPVDGTDPQYPGERTWSLNATIGHGAPAGMARIRFAAVGEDGGVGPTRDVNLCISPDYPDNLNACDPTLSPPALVVQLQWDRDVDLDLAITRPDGSVLSNATSDAPDGKTKLPGAIDTDSLAGCKSDPRRTENAYWQDKPKGGVYGIGVRFTSACGQSSVRYVVRALLRQPGELAGTWQQTEVARWTGTLLASQLETESAPPWSVGNLELP